MRICKVPLNLVILALSFWITCANAQVVQTTRPFVNTNPQTAITPQSVIPNLATSNATPAVNPNAVVTVMPAPGAPAITPSGIRRSGGATQGSTTAIGQQGTIGIGRQGTTAIGQQSTTAIGQQGFGTAIGQQGFGTAPAPVETNGIVIGQPEPSAVTPVNPPQIANPGVGIITTNRMNQRVLTPGGPAINAPATAAPPLAPAARPTGKR